MYKTVLKRGTLEFEEKKSIFISHVSFCETEEEAINFIEDIKTEHAQATHNCYAYIIGENMGVQRYSDDGEPQGSAGLPILNVLKRENVVNTCIVVTRYFGGVLLGKGGLYRAYGKGGSLGLEAGVVVEMTEYEKLSLSYDYTYHGAVNYFLNTNNIHILEENFTDKVMLKLYVKSDDFEKFYEEIQNLTSANNEIIEKSQVLLPTKDGEIMGGIK